MPGPEKKYGINDIAQTITDLYSGTKIEDIIEAGWIVDSKGYPVRFDKGTEEGMKKLTELLEKQDNNAKIYFQNVPNKNGPGEKTYTLELVNDKFEPLPSNKKLINPEVKSETLIALADINEKLQKYTGKNPDMQALKGQCEQLIKDLAVSVDKNEFDVKLDEFAQSAEHYYAGHAPASLNRRQVRNTSLAYNILQVRNAVEKGEVPTKPDRVEELQSRMAAKYLSAYCLHTIKKDEDPDAVREAQEILDTPSLFNEKLGKVKEDPSFQYMYGSRMEGDEKDVLDRLSDGLHTKAAKVFKKVEKERLFPESDRLQIQAMKKQTPPKRLQGDKQYESMSLQDQKPIGEMVHTLREQLDAIGGSGTSSPEFEKLKHELLVADIRLQRGNPNMDVKREIAELGDCVDAYVNKKMQEGKLNSRGLERLGVAMQLRTLCDGVEHGKALKEVTKNPIDKANKDMLIERITKQMAKEMTKKKDPRVAKEGAAIFGSREALAAAKKQLSESKAFNELFNDPEKIKAALSEKPAKIYKQILKQERKNASPEAVKEAKEKKVEQSGPKPVKKNEKEAQEIELQMI